MIGDPSVLGYYMQLALEDVDQNVWANACIGIGDMGGREYLGVLRTAMAGESGFVRRAAEVAEKSILSK